MVGGVVDSFCELEEFGVCIEDDESCLVERTQTNSFGIIGGGP